LNDCDNIEVNKQIVLKRECWLDDVRKKDLKKNSKSGGRKRRKDRKKGRKSERK
jgi:hypothetical protein